MLHLAEIDVVILAGGLGKRLASVTGGGQKVLAQVGDKPFISLLIDYIASFGGHRFILCTGHGAQAVEDHLRVAHPTLDIVFSREDTPLGTGGAIKKGSGLVKSSRFLAMNGDCFCVIDYNQMVAFHVAKGAQATIAVTRIDDARDYGTIETNGHQQITAFKEKQAQQMPALINTGTYCFDRNIFTLVATPEKFSIEYDFFPHLVNQGFYGFDVQNKFIDIGTPERYAWAQEHIRELR